MLRNFAIRATEANVIALAADQRTFKWKGDKKLKKVNSERFRLTVFRSTKNISAQIIDEKSKKTLIKVGEQINFLTAKKLENEGLKEILVSNNVLYGKFLHQDITIEEDTYKIGPEDAKTLENTYKIGAETFEIHIKSVPKAPKR